MRFVAGIALLMCGVATTAASADALTTRTLCSSGNVSFDGDVGGTSAECANTFDDPFSTYVGTANARADAEEGTLRVYTELGVNWEAPTDATATITESFVVDQAWTGDLEYTPGIVGLNAPQFLALNDLAPLTHRSLPISSAIFSLAITVSATNFGVTDRVEFHYVTDDWIAVASQKRLMNVSKTSAEDFLSAAALLPVNLPDRLVGQAITTSWSVNSRQYASGFVNAYGTGDIAVTLPTGYSYTPSSPDFLSARARPVPEPAGFGLLGLGLAALCATTCGRSRGQK